MTIPRCSPPPRTPAKSKTSSSSPLRYHTQRYPRIAPTEIVHGWRDDIILYEHSVRYARNNGATLHLVDANHFFYAPHEIALLCRHFSGFLARFPSPAAE